MYENHKYLGQYGHFRRHSLPTQEYGLLLWIVFLPSFDLLPLFVAADEVPDGEFLFAVPTLLCLIPILLETINKPVNGAYLADVETTTGHHLWIGKGKFTDLAEQ